MKITFGLLLIASLLAGCAAPLKPAANAPAKLYLANRNLVNAGHGDACEWEFPAGAYDLLGENDQGLYYKPETTILMPNPNQGDIAHMLQGDRVPAWGAGIAVSRSDLHADYAIANRVWATDFIIGRKPGIPHKLGGKIFLSRSPGGIRRADWWRE